MALGIKVPKNVFTAGREKFAEGDDFNNVELEPGRYTCILKKGRAVETSKGPQIVLDLEVAGDSDKKGGKIGLFFALTEERVVWLFRVLTLLGYEVTELDEAVLEEILNDIAKTTPVVRVTAKNSGEYTNYRIDKLLADLTAADARGGGEGEDETAADEDAGGGKAGIKENAHAKAGKKEADPPKAAPKAPVKKVVEPEPEPEPEAEAEEVEEEPAAEEEVELTVGMEVKANIKGVTQSAKVLEIGEDGKVLILAADKKKYRIALEKLEL